MLFKKLEVIYTLCVFFVLVKAQVYKPCRIRNTNAKGICKIDFTCPKANEDAARGISPTICGILYRSITVVCCEGAKVTNIEASENPFISFGTQDDGILTYENNNEFPKASILPISDQKCFEYNKNTMESVELSNSRPSGALITQCNYDARWSLVADGAPASPGEFPFMAILGYNDGKDNEREWLCGGTLISDFYVMTAAQCLVRRIPGVVRLGELDLSRDDDNSYPEDFDIIERIIHPHYRGGRKENDIALIRLSKRVQFTNFIRPACLWNKPIAHNSATATGWGTSGYGADQSNVLQKVYLDIYNKSICDEPYKREFKNGLPHTMLCAGDLKGERDTCQGDSGGPLFITKEDNQCIFYTVGITSFGKKCATVNTPAVYTKVSEYIPWIENIVWKS